MESTINTRGEAYANHRTKMLEKIAELKDLQEKLEAQSEKARERFEKRGKLLPRERLELLLDRGSSFIELCGLAGLGMHDDDGKKRRRRQRRRRRRENITLMISSIKTTTTGKRTTTTTTTAWDKTETSYI